MGTWLGISTKWLISVVIIVTENENKFINIIIAVFDI